MNRYRRTNANNKNYNEPKITKMDFFQDGLSGGENSTLKRMALIKKTATPSAGED